MPAYLQHVLIGACTAILLGMATGCGIPDTPAPPGLLVDATQEAGLSGYRHTSAAMGQRWFPETMGAGAGFIDYNNDDWPDILLVNGAHWKPTTPLLPAVTLLRNNQDGTFSNVTAETGLSQYNAYGFGLTVADYDNDGDEDFFLTTLHQNLLFNNRDGVFTEVGHDSAIGAASEWSTAAMFFDADADGHLDLLVGNYVDWSPATDQFCTIDRQQKEYCTPELYRGLPLRLYRNDGNGGFEDISKQSGVDVPAGKTLGLAMLDFNKDSHIDFIAANDTVRDLLFLNLGNGTFEEIGLRSGLALSQTGRASAGMGIDIGVVDDTGEPTVFIGNFSKESIGVFQHRGNGLFKDRGTTSQIGRPSFLTLTFGLLLLDIDLDGYLDLFAANGHVHQDVARIQEGITHAQPPQLFLNDGTGRFSAQAPQPGSVLADSLVARGAAYADYDRDGDLDILVTENNGPVHLWKNTTPTQYSLQLKLTGDTSNRGAIGALITITSAAGIQYRRVVSGSSYLSASSRQLTFGTPDQETVQAIIHWPSGHRDTLDGLSSGQSIRIYESDAEFDVLNRFR